ncbi:Enoyl-CoA hydratase/carnithine racemase [uncultured delta proteobacterium]|uniref:Enoyl-CoA hydratase/carnithine racemase n=1 Tax=uncultured delta proteobacterium TaxID=34034 RepID=A0A212KA39_9DELT|nr:Enoyl-CoA hydratase/carnithine racemase [uncultured delta proteobacterium]
MSEYVLYSVENGIGQLSVNRPEVMNALNNEVTNAIGALLDDAAADKNLKVLIVGSKDNFGAGADVDEFVDYTPEQVRQSPLMFACNKLELLPVPTIAAVEGYALGGALELALACDFRIAGAGAQMGFPEINLGLFPGAGGTVRLSRLIGPSRAKDMIFMGKNVDAEAALALGLVNSVAPAGEAGEKAKEMAVRLARKSAPGLAAAKQALAAAAAIPDMLPAVAETTRIFSTLMGTPDQQEGMRAFMEKRRPDFRGQRL